MSRAACILWVALCANIAWAQGSAKGARRVVARYEGGFTLSCPPATVEHPTCELSGPGRPAPLSLPSLYAEHYHPVEVRPGRVFWVQRRPGAPDEVRLTEWASGKERLVAQASDFRASPDGQEAFLQSSQEEDGVRLLRWRQASPKLEKLERHEEGFSLLGWSRDGRWFWFGRGVVGGWSELALWERDTGKARAVPGPQDSDTFQLNPDTGRYARESSTEGAPCFDADCEKERRQAGANRLLVRSAFGGADTVVAERKDGKSFNARWQPDGSLSYELARGRKAQWKPSK